MPMSLRGTCLGAVLSVAAAPVHAEVLFHETFGTGRCDAVFGGGAGTYTFPAGWLLRNVDNHTPVAPSSFVSDAWAVRGDDAEECVAFSNSFYTLAGQADDWMWSPAVSLPSAVVVLRWRAMTYDDQAQDGYQVRIMVEPAVPTGGTGDLGNQVSSSTEIFSVPAEASTWVTREVDVSAYAGQTIRVGFRNSSYNEFLLLIDDVRLERLYPVDPALHAPVDVLSGGYAKVPAFLGYPFDVQATVANAGTQALSGVTVTGDVLLDGVPVQPIASTPVALAAGASQPVPLADGAYLQPGMWSVEAVVTASEGDEGVANSAQAVELLEVTANELTRANGNPSRLISLSNYAGGELGNDFVLPSEAMLVGVRYTVYNFDSDPGDGVGDFNGMLVQATVRAWDTVNDYPGALLHTAGTVVPSDAPIGLLVLDFPVAGRLLLPAGRYLVAGVQPVGKPIDLLTDTGRFTPGTSWITSVFSPEPWLAMESLGPQYAEPFRVSALLQFNFRPVAEDDAFSFVAYGILEGSVAANDVMSADGGNLFSLVSDVDRGELQLGGDGSFIYTADANVGTTSFTYALCDADASCDQATATIQVSAQPEVDVLFEETFEGCTAGVDGPGPGSYPFPDGWLLRNVDNRTPHDQVAEVNEAWEVIPDLFYSNCAAGSTSWYEPAGAADDWMWTPAVAIPDGTSVLQWRAVTAAADFRDGYEVRVMVEPTAPTGGTGAIGNQATGSTVVFSTPAERTAWTSRSVDLLSYAGQSIRVGFRNNSNDRSLLLVDDVRVVVDVASQPSILVFRDSFESN